MPTFAVLKPLESITTALRQTVAPESATAPDSRWSFIVAMPAEIIEPDPAADPVGYAQVREAIARSVATDTATVFADALRARAQPRINQTVLDNVSGQQ